MTTDTPKTLAELRRDRAVAIAQREAQLEVVEEAKEAVTNAIVNRNAQVDRLVKIKEQIASIDAEIGVLRDAQEAHATDAA